MEKVDKLKKNFHKKEKIEGYIIPKNDEFFNEYIPDHNNRLNYITKLFWLLWFGFNFKKERIIYSLTEGTLYRQTTKAENPFKIITIPDKMPSDFLK